MDPGNTITASLNQITELVEKRTEFIAFVKKWIDGKLIEYNLLDYILEGPDRVIISPSFLLSQELPYTPDEKPSDSLNKIKEITEPIVLSFFRVAEKKPDFIGRSGDIFGLMRYDEITVGRTTMDFLKELFENCELTEDVLLRQHFQILSIVIMVFREIYEFRGKKELELFHKSFNIGGEEKEEGIGGIEGGLPVTIGGKQPVRRRKGKKKGGLSDDEGIGNLFDQNVGGGREDLDIRPIPTDARNTRLGDVVEPSLEEIINKQEKLRAFILRTKFDCAMLLSKLSDYRELREEWIVSRNREGDTTYMENLRIEVINDYYKLADRFEYITPRRFGTVRRDFLNTFPEYTDEWFEKKYIEKIKV